MRDESAQKFTDVLDTVGIEFERVQLSLRVSLCKAKLLDLLLQFEFVALQFLLRGMNGGNRLSVSLYILFAWLY